METQAGVNEMRTLGHKDVKETPYMSRAMVGLIYGTDLYAPRSLKDTARWVGAIQKARKTDLSAERERAQIIIKHMCDTALPHLTEIAVANGFGPEWEDMIKIRSCHSANEARWAADAALENAPKGPVDEGRVEDGLMTIFWVSRHAYDAISSFEYGDGVEYDVGECAGHVYEKVCEILGVSWDEIGICDLLETLTASKEAA